jgi:hypothetical protein
MKRYKLMIAALITAPIVVLFALLYQNTVEAHACPLKDRADRILVLFGPFIDKEVGYGQVDKGALTTTRNSIGPLEVDIPPGTYKITMVSHDHHTDNPQEEDQTQERWFLQGQDEEGFVVFKSLAISDLPRSENLLTKVVQARAQIRGHITGLFAKHFLDVGGSLSTESVTPLCVAFDPV